MTEPRLTSLNDLVGGDDLAVPPEINIALGADRYQFVATLKGREHSAEAVDAFLDTIIVLMRTNRALRLHAQRLTDKIERLAETIDEMHNAIGEISRVRRVAFNAVRQLRDIAQFDRHHDDEDDC
jgi:hypothetical protein